MMKKIYSNISRMCAAVVVIAMTATACVDDFAVGDASLEKQPGVDVTSDTVFSHSEYARMFLWDNYKYIYHGFSQYNCLNSVMIDGISDIVHSYLGWGGVIETYYSGMHSEAGNGSYVRDKLAFVDGTNNRKGIWGAVRKSWQFIENVDRVPDMETSEKQRLKAEARLIIATRYYDALCHFGGLPLVDHAYETGEEMEGGYLSGINGEGEFVAGRATVEQTATFIDNLLQQVIDEPNLPFAITDTDNEGGRLTKGGAYALRAKLWQYVASPLFNDTEPYREYSSTPEIPSGYGDDVDPLLRVWLGRKDPSMWQKCLEACEDFFSANQTAGNPYALHQASGTSENDYRQAYRDAYFSRETTEKIIDVRGEGNSYSDGEYLLEWGSNVPGNVGHYGGHAPTLEWFNMFPWADGRNFDGQRVYDTDNEENLDIFQNRDPRLYESILVPQRNLNNKYNTYQNKVIDLWEGGEIISGNWWFTSGFMAHGFGQFKWLLDFSDLSEQRYSWPYLRMADMHLTYAEALAQTGNTSASLEQVDKVRARVGLPSLAVNTDLDLTDTSTLIEEILRERACELGLENSRIMDLLRYKRSDIFQQTLHRITVYPKDATTGEKTSLPYSSMNGVWPSFIYETEPITSYARIWWSGNWDNKWLLSPITRDEISKGYGLTQNPGW